MFKALIGKGHPEFSTNRQQDAQEFFLHLINMVEVRAGKTVREGTPHSLHLPEVLSPFSLLTILSSWPQPAPPLEPRGLHALGLPCENSKAKQ